MSKKKKPKILQRPRGLRIASQITTEEMDKAYKELESIHKKYLKKHGVKIPGRKSKLGCALIYFYLYQGKAIRKSFADDFVTYHHPNNAQPQVRHLSAEGWNVQGSARGDPDVKSTTKQNATFTLVDANKPHPSYKPKARDSKLELTEEEWNEIKKQFSDDKGRVHCASCGAIENEPHYITKTITKIQKGHKDPSKPLTKSNCIPQCEHFCNEVYKNKFIFDNKGRMKAIAEGKILLKSNDDTIINALKSVIENKPNLIQRLGEDSKKALLSLLEEE